MFLKRGHRFSDDVRVVIGERAKIYLGFFKRDFIWPEGRQDARQDNERQDKADVSRTEASYERSRPHLLYLNSQFDHVRGICLNISSYFFSLIVISIFKDFHESIITLTRRCAVFPNFFLFEVSDTSLILKYILGKKVFSA